MVEPTKPIPDFLRGILIPDGTSRNLTFLTLQVRVFFVVDTNVGVLHVFESIKQQTPSYSLSIG